MNKDHRHPSEEQKEASSGFEGAADVAARESDAPDDLAESSQMRSRTDASEGSHETDEEQGVGRALNSELSAASSPGDAEGQAADSQGPEARDDVSTEEQKDARNSAATEPPRRLALGDDDQDDEAGTGSTRMIVEPGVGYSVFGRTDVGLVREHNEDNFTVFDLETRRRGIEGDVLWRGAVGQAGFVAAVCDGMGGAAAGEVASQMAVDTIFSEMEALPPPGSRDEFAARLVHAVETAGANIFEASRADRNRRGMGTTATVVGLVDRVLFIGQVGDSRAYLLRANTLTQLTKDQSLVNQLIEAGQLTEEEAEGFEHSNIILQALGTTEDVTVDLTFVELCEGDRLMLCSDGLSGMVHAATIEEVMVDTPDPRMVCARLIEMANVGGGHDNITCIVVDFEGGDLKPPGTERPVYQQYALPRDPAVEELAAAAGAATSTSDPSRAGASPPRPTTGIPRWAIGLVIALVVALVVIFKLSSPTPPELPPKVVEPVPPPPQLPPLRPMETVEVEVRSNVIGGELLVGDSSVGEIADQEPIFLELSPGEHTLRILVDGTATLAEHILVQAGTPMVVELFLEETPRKPLKKPLEPAPRKPTEPEESSTGSPSKPPPTEPEPAEPPPPPPPPPPAKVEPSSDPAPPS